MSAFLETICILDGHPRYLDWHQRRVDATLRHFYPDQPIEEITFSLSDILSSCDIPANGLFRCRIIYDINAIDIEFFTHEPRLVNSLCLIEAPAGYDYGYKYADRKVLEALFAQRGDADDILITRKGWITDTSIANIAFRKDHRWYTPSIPLLAGTTWKRLVVTGHLIPRPIHQLDVHRYDAYKLFNAMNDWDTIGELPVSSINTSLF